MKRTLTSIFASVFGLGTVAAQPAPPVAPASTPENVARKERSVAVLKRENVPMIDWLPMIESEAESTRRTKEEVVKRTIALVIVAVKGETNDYDLARALVGQFDAKGYFTPDEQAFMDEREPSEEDRSKYSWRYEDVHVLLWALGVFPELGRPDQICDVPKIAVTMRELGPQGLMAKAALRPQSEILDAADLIYRYHWAVVDARVKNEAPPAGLDKGVVYERHYVLNWLIGYQNQDWDDISTDT